MLAARALLHTARSTPLSQVYEGHGQAINDIAAHPMQPHLVATASKDHGIRLWNLCTRVTLVVC